MSQYLSPEAWSRNRHSRFRWCGNKLYPACEYSCPPKLGVHRTGFLPAHDRHECHASRRKPAWKRKWIYWILSCSRRNWRTRAPDGLRNRRAHGLGTALHSGINGRRYRGTCPDDPRGPADRMRMHRHLNAYAGETVKFARLVSAIATCVLAGAVGGCAPHSDASSHRLSIVATTGILADFARNVGGDYVDVHQLIPNVADPHSGERGLRESAILLTRILRSRTT